MENPIVISRINAARPRPVMEELAGKFREASLLVGRTAESVAQQAVVPGIDDRKKLEIVNPDSQSSLVFQMSDDLRQVERLTYKYPDQKRPNFSRNYALVRRADSVDFVQDEFWQYETALASGDYESGLLFEKGIGPVRQLRALGVLGIFKAHLDCIQEGVK